MNHPGFKWACGAVEFIVIDVMLILGITPAWAAVSIPLTDKITINLGELPQWIVALVAAGGFWKAWRAEQASKLNAVVLTGVSKQIDGLLAERDKGNLAKGEARGVAAGEAKAEQLAEGQRQGIEIGRDMPARSESAGASPALTTQVEAVSTQQGKAAAATVEAAGKTVDAAGKTVDAAAKAVDAMKKN